MANVLLVAYLLIVLALIVVILLQRSEGGALGIGGGGGGGLMTARGSANLLTRTTAILATLFFASAIGLTILSELDRGTSSILDSAITTPSGEQPSTVLDALNALQGEETSDLLLPNEAQQPAAPAGADTDLPVPPAPADTTTTAPVTTEAAPAAPAAESSDLPVPAAPAEQTPAAPPAN
jgi:preprotein translocase subunit SecG